VKKKLDQHGLVPEFVAPRLWEDPRTIDGGYTANCPQCRKYALERSKRCIDIANALGTKNIVLWLAREGTYIRESKDSVEAAKRIANTVQAMRTQKMKESAKHLRNSREIFLKLLAVSRGLSDAKMNKMIKDRDYEELDLYIMTALLGG
jgi:L-rhamnose isomerase